jgi:hypothetical protein
LVQSEYINAQNNRYWSNSNGRQAFEVPVHNQKICAWCAITATKIAELIFFEQTINLEQYVSDILWPLFESTAKEEKVILCKMVIQHTRLLIPLIF